MLNMINTIHYQCTFKFITHLKIKLVYTHVDHSFPYIHILRKPIPNLVCTYKWHLYLSQIRPDPMNRLYIRILSNNNYLDSVKPSQNLFNERRTSQASFSTAQCIHPLLHHRLRKRASALSLSIRGAHHSLAPPPARLSSDRSSR